MRSENTVREPFGARAPSVSHRVDAIGLEKDRAATLPGPAVGGAYERAKRAIDIAIAATILVLGAPLWIVLALAIKLDSRGPVLFRRTVIGRYGRPFTYYKYRTMSHNCSAAPHESFIDAYVSGSNGRTAHEYAPGKLSNDSRISRLGRLLRKSSFDEFPQLINVLRGEMSIVGPRPPVPYEYALYDGRAKRRLDVLPGITGLFQITGRGRKPFRAMLAADLLYVRKRSIWLDVAIMARTIPTVLSTRGAA